MPKLFFGPPTTFQLKSFIKPMAGVKRTSNPPPNWPTALVSLPLLRAPMTSPPDAKIRSPQVNIPLCIPIPLRTRRLLHCRLFHFLARRVGFGSAEREARERSRGTHHNCKSLHHSSLVRFPLVAIPHSVIALFTNNATGPSGGCARRRNSCRKTSFRGGF